MTAGVVVITGGGGGMGAACARTFADADAIVVADLSPERYRDLVADLRAAGVDAYGVQCDISDAGAVTALAETVRGLGPLRALVHTAGLSSTMGSAERIIAVNLLGTAQVLAAFVDQAREGTVAVCVASVAGHRIGPEAHDAVLATARTPGLLQRLRAAGALRDEPGRAYDLSKRGVILLVEREAAAWGARGARLLSLSPGLIDTPMGAEAANGGRGSNMTLFAALGRHGHAEEIADVVAFMCSPAARFVTGTDIRVDGGVIAGVRHTAPAQAAERWNGWEWGRQAQAGR
jgi:NAD(P)-dependent dehydrogenase (short-subunit alcohol dehydrogenase family)